MIASRPITPSTSRGGRHLRNERPSIFEVGGVGMTAGSDKKAGWCILRTAGPSTMRLTASLQDAGLTAWTPTEHVRRRVPRAKTTEHRIVPMVATYVFVRAGHLADLQRIERAEITPHPQFSIFRHCGDTVFIPNGSLHALRQLQQASYRGSLPGSGSRSRKPRGAPYEQGEAVTFSQGPFSGLQGFVETSDGLTTRLNIELFGRVSVVDVKTLHLRALNVPVKQSAA